jgi:pilus assembly protein CpaD
MKARQFPFVALSAALAAGLCACATQAPPPEESNLATRSDRHKIAVMQSGETLEVPVRAGETRLSEAARREIALFAREYVRGGHGALVISTPSGSGNADSAARLAHLARLEIAANGVPFAAIAGSTYDAASTPDAAIILSFTRFNAQAPECAPLWKQDLSDVSSNGPWDSFGCASQANLAAMIDDPADLVRPRDSEPRDAARRANVLEAYRKGDQTHAKRSSDERVTVSNAVE